jgi:hypothetical protein
MLPMTLLKRLTTRLKMPERLKKIDKQPISPRKWKRDSLNLKRSMNTSG